MKDTIIIGGGISGLAVAFFLKQKGYDVLLLEKENRVGGVIRSTHKDGYLLEEGPNTLMGNSEAVREMLETLGLDKEKIFPPSHARKRYIYHHKNLHKVSLFSPMLLFSLLKEPFISKAKTNETVYEFFVRRLGKKVTETYVDSFVTGIYAGNMHKLEMRSAFPKLWKFEQNDGGIIKGYLKSLLKSSTVRGDRTCANGSHLYSFENGVETLPKALEQWLGASILKNVVISKVEKEKNGFSVSIGTKKKYTQSLVIATSKHLTPPLEYTLIKPVAQTVLARCGEAAKTVEREVHTLAGACDTVAYEGMFQMGAFNEMFCSYQNINCKSLKIFYLGYEARKIKHPLNGFGFLIPRSENKKTLGVLWSSSLFENRAPKGHVLLTVMAKANSSFDEVKQEIEFILGIQGEPSFVHEKSIVNAIPQYELGHAQKKQEIETILKENPGLFITGNFLNGVSVNSCIESGHMTAASVDAFFSFQT